MSKKNRKLRIVQVKPTILVKILEGVRVVTETDYRVRFGPCDPTIGEMAAEWSKLGPIGDGEQDLYDLRYAYCPVLGHRRWHCDCIGHTQHGTCKHADATPVILERVGTLAT